MDLKRKGILISILMVTFLLALIPEGSGVESRDAIVRVEHAGYYSGRISGDEVQEVYGEYNMDFPTRGQIIYVIMEKSGADNNEMTVSIIVDGETKISRSTSEPNGEIRMTWSFYVGGDDDGGEEGVDDDDNTADEGDDGFGISCASLLLISILTIIAAMMITARIKKGS